MGNKAVLIIGGGLAGIQSALEQAESGNTVYLLENSPGIGGERLLYDEDSKTVDFVSPDLEKVKKNKNIRIITNADIEKVEEMEDVTYYATKGMAGKRRELLGLLWI